MAFQCRAASCASWEQELPPRASEGDYRVPKVTNQVNRHDDPPYSGLNEGARTKTSSQGVRLAKEE